MAEDNFVETSSKQIRNTSVVSDCSIDPDNHKLGHQKSVLMNPEDATSTSKSHSVTRRMKHNISSASIGVINTLRYKVLIISVMCCIIACCLIPVIMYTVYSTLIDSDGTDAGCLNNANTNVCCMHYSK